MATVYKDTLDSLFCFVFLWGWTDCKKFNRIFLGNPFVYIVNLRTCFYILEKRKDSKVCNIPV